MKACKNCQLIIEKGTHCPICKKDDLSESFKGIAIIFNIEKSKIAKELKAQTVGSYALTVK